MLIRRRKSRCARDFNKEKEEQVYVRDVNKEKEEQVRERF